MMDLPPSFDFGWIRFWLGAIIGGCIGSFVTMLAWRVPRGESIVAPRSHCTSCNATLRPRDLVPLVSFLSIKGHCRYCGAKIGWRYFWIELGFTVAGGLAGFWI